MFVYYVDRLCVVHSIHSKKQRFYEEHKNKVTAICVHPGKSLVCSVESPSLTNDSVFSIVTKSKIHIWSSNTLRKEVML